MDFNKLQKKLVLRLTSPIELLYVISSHWFLILFFTGIGLLVMFARVTSEPPVYSASTVLLLDPKDPMAEEGMLRLARGDTTNFVQNQVQILQSDTVITKVIEDMSYDQILAQEYGEEDVKQGLIQKVYRKIAEQLEYYLGKLVPPSSGNPDEKLSQRAVAMFRRRSEVITQRGSNQVRLRVWGTLREGLIRELNAWIDAYRKRVEDFVGATYKRYYEERIANWNKEVREANAKLDQFRKQNPEVSETMQRINQEKIIKLQIIIDRLNNQIQDLSLGNSLSSIGTPAASGEKDFLDFLLIKKRDLGLLRAEKLGPYPETSHIIHDVEEKIRVVTEQIDNLQNPQKFFTSGEDREKSVVEKNLKNYLQAAKEDLDMVLKNQMAIDGKMIELKQLQDDARYKLDNLRRLDQLYDWHSDIVEGRKQVQIQFLDPPNAGTTPINAFIVFRVAYGILAGLALGFFLSFFLEFFYPRIRFKRDVIEELGLEVIGVLPKK